VRGAFEHDRVIRRARGWRNRRRLGITVTDHLPQVNTTSEYIMLVTLRRRPKFITHVVEAASTSCVPNTDILTRRTRAALVVTRALDIFQEPHLVRPPCFRTRNRIDPISPTLVPVSSKATTILFIHHKVACTCHVLVSRFCTGALH